MKDHIAIVTGATPDRMEEAEICLKFLNRWGGKYYFDVIPDGVNPLMWKYDTVRSKLDDHEIVAWMDTDSCVLNRDMDLVLKLHEWSLPSTQMWCSQDWNGLCTAFFAFRRGQFANDFCASVSFVGRDIAKMIDPDLKSHINNKADGDQAIVKMFYYVAIRHQWRIVRLPYEVVTERASRPWPMPFIWHCGPNPLELMRKLWEATEDGTLEHFCKNYPSMKHGYRYDL